MKHITRSVRPASPTGLTRREKVVRWFTEDIGFFIGDFIMGIFELVLDLLF